VFSDFIRSLADLNTDELMKMMQSFLSKGVVTFQKGFERVADEAKASLEEKKLLADKNRRLREENEKLKNQSRQLKDQSAKQQTAINALKWSWKRAYSAMKSVVLN
jgi:polyhydroxyalkanoate synthesis regulator protein